MAAGRDVSGGASDRSGVEPGVHGEGRAGEERLGDDAEPAEVGEGEAGQPLVPRRGVDAQGGVACPGRGADGTVGEHDALGLARRAAGGHHQGIAVLDLVARPQAPQDPLACRPREAVVEGQHRVAAVPRPPEAGHEPLVGLDCHQAGHGR